MRYEEFKAKVIGQPLISRQFLDLVEGVGPGFWVQFRRWVKAGKILKLRKGLYFLDPADRRINPSRLFIAGEIYSPSYVSMEYALSSYSLIPEKTADITCITTKKTAAFKNALGRFTYQHVKEKCFTGFHEVRDEAGLVYFMASPEKAAVDFIYLNRHKFKDNYAKALYDSFRFQNADILKKVKLFEYAKLFNDRKLILIVTALLRGLNNE